jgi:hypothetical protein
MRVYFIVRTVKEKHGGHLLNTRVQDIRKCLGCLD